MKFIPILFSTPMVQAERANRKTKTRRTKGLEKINQNPDDWQFEWADFSLKLPWRFTQKSTVNNDSLKENSFNQEAIKCPYGQIGDILWVKEKFREYLYVDENDCICFDKKIIEYAADNPPLIPQMDRDGSAMYNKDGSEKFIPWKPSLFMPKSACRTFLQIKSIKVERLQDISEEDAKEEGVLFGRTCSGVKETLFKDYSDNSFTLKSAKKSFQSLWKSINGQESWNANPWVWVIEFQRIEKPENFK